jgi:hypothetical protein
MNSNAQKKFPAINSTAPAWLYRLLDAGYQPYIATSRHVMSALNTSPFGLHTNCSLLDDDNELPFLEAYLLSNSLSFNSPNLKMPHWVMIDCALMQSAIVGFTKSVADCPRDLLKHYKRDLGINFERLERIPVSGQIASPATNRDLFIGISLFSLGQSHFSDKGLGLYTKALALEVYNAQQTRRFCGISQYDNPALKIHGRFGSRMRITQATVPLHPKRDMTLIYEMKIEYDPHQLDERPSAIEPSFWLAAQDLNAKVRIQAGIRAGRSYYIVPPFAVQNGESIFLPIVEE